MSTTTPHQSGGRVKLTAEEKAAKQAEAAHKKVEAAAQKVAAAAAKKAAVAAEKVRKSKEAAAKKEAENEAKQAEAARKKAEAAEQRAAAAAVKKAAAEVEKERKKNEAAAKKQAEKAAKQAAAEAEKHRKETRIAEASGKLVDLIRSQRHASAESYPVADHRLMELADIGLKPAELRVALGKPEFTAAVVKCSLPPKQAAFLLRSDLEDIWPPLVLHGLRLTAAKNRTAASKTNVATGSEIAAVFLNAAEPKKRLAAAIERAADHKALPADIAWVWSKGLRLFFLSSDAEPHGVRSASPGTSSPGTSSPGTSSPGTSSPGTAAPGTSASNAAAEHRHAAVPAPSADRQHTAAHDFAAHFDTAFARLDGQMGQRNFLKLSDLRHALPQFSREAFDAGLHELRLKNRYTLDSAQGGTVRLTDDERAAGIQEGSSLLVYISRK
jgi:hypothetical protein